ncbi:MAG: HD domain-containing protein [Flavobacteriales bacterium]|nr:HD domain-containing protein [Flavobacteriales bacterium]
MDYAGAIERILKQLEANLPAHLYYHGHHHTLDVLEAVERIGKSENISELQQNLLLVAAAYHDCGFLEGHQNHEIKGCEIARENLPDFGFKEQEIENICEMIMATKVPQSPKNHLEEILCDADLDYLGRDDFEPIGSNLFKELEHLGILAEIKAWNRIQLSFLSQHVYHTAYGKTIRQPEKQKHLDKIRQVVNSYDS